MNPKRILLQIGGTESEIDRIMEQIIKTETRLTHITPVLSDMPGGGSGGDKMIDGVSDLIEWRDRLKEKIRQLIHLKHEALNAIELIPDERYRTILTGHYFNGEPLTKLAYEMKYDYYYLVALHKQALREFAKHHNKS